MTADDFRAVYDPDRRCLATYRQANGDRVSGVILDDVQTSTTGQPFVYIDNFVTRVTLDAIEDVKPTRLWRPKGDT